MRRYPMTSAFHPIVWCSSDLQSKLDPYYPVGAKQSVDVEAAATYKSLFIAAIDVIKRQRLLSSRQQTYFDGQWA